MKTEWIKKIFEWLGKALVCVAVAVGIRMFCLWAGSSETMAAQFGGMAISIFMYESGMLKKWTDL